MTTTKSWQLSTPADAIIFDCDGTLSQLEGIDELARKNGVYAAVAALTADAMARLGITIPLYQQRLDLVKPTQEQTIAVGHAYYEHLNPDTQAVIQLFQQLNKPVFIVSSGLYASVGVLGQHLNIPQKNIFAVDMSFDAQGNYIDFDRSSPLVTSKGKQVIVADIKKTYPNIVYVGDGLNDFAAYRLVNRFIGYGGAFYRENIAAMCEYYIRSASMTPLLPLALTATEVKQLTTDNKSLYEQGLKNLENGGILMHHLDKTHVERTLLELGILN